MSGGPVHGRPYLRFMLRRLKQLGLIVLGIAIINFFLLHLAPGDVADVLAGEAGTADATYVQDLRTAFGLDQPLYAQFFTFLWRLAHFDLGYSYAQGRSVVSLIADRLPATLLLMGSSLLIAVLFGMVLGIVAARNFNRAADNIISLLALVFYATPLFWLGLMLIVLFSVKLGWLPTGGMYDVVARAQGWRALPDLLRHLVLPSLTLSFFFLAVYTRLMRASILEILGMDYIRLARAKGLSETRIMVRHVLRNALLPLVTMVGMQIASFMGGSVLVETVFSWPGLGRLMFEAVFQRDLNLLLSVLFISSIFVVLVNLAVDIAYLFLDPRIEVA
jgi:peptide/nickel transport system permease protein